MPKKLERIIDEMRRDMSVPAESILEHTHELVDEALGNGLLGYEEDLNRIVIAARELNRRISEILTINNEDVRELMDDPSSLGRKLRHDLRNAIGAVKGYLEMLDEDVQDAGDLSLAPNVSRLLTATIRLGTRLDEVVTFETEIAPAQAQMVAPAELEGGIARADLVDDEAVITGRILVVDDLEANRELICARLKRDGHEVFQAGNGTEALEMLRDLDIDVVLLDLMMPEVSGFDVMAEMKKRPTLRNVRIIVISALDQEENAIKSITLGALDYLPKPVNPVLLRARIGSCLARKQWRDQERLYRLHLEAEKNKSEALLLNTLPELVVKRLASGEKVIADAYDNVTVVFSDFVNFTGFASGRQADEVVEVLNSIFTEFDDLALDLGVEKIKTVGDGYLAVAGLPVQRPDHAEIAADFALGMIEILESVNRRLGIQLEMRVGLHSGPVVAGIIGSHKFAYDVWGHTVNIAARHESYSAPQQIHISAQTASLLESKFELVPQAALNIRGLGRVDSFFLGPRIIGVPVAQRPSRTGETADGHMSILIADDDQTIRDFMTRRIRRRGWRVAAASDGKEAWEMLQKGRYDLLITDCDMPDVDGLQLTRRIRHSEEFTGDRMSIVALTGADDIEAPQRCLSAGMDAFLQKPFIWGELEKCILALRDKNAPAKPETRSGVMAARPLDILTSDDFDESNRILDLSAVEEIFGGINRKALEALNDLQESVGESVTKMLAATQERDFEKASKAAHAVLGSTRTAGANELTEVCTQFKQALDERDVVSVGILTEHVAMAFERLRDRIDALGLARRTDAGDKSERLMH